jgi:hypothetical protein
MPGGSITSPALMLQQEPWLSPHTAQTQPGYCCCGCCSLSPQPPWVLQPRSPAADMCGNLSLPSKELTCWLAEELWQSENDVKDAMQQANQRQGTGVGNPPQPLLEVLLLLMVPRVWLWGPQQHQSPYPSDLAPAAWSVERPQLMQANCTTWHQCVSCDGACVSCGREPQSHTQLTISGSALCTEARRLLNTPCCLAVHFPAQWKNEKDAKGRQFRIWLTSKADQQRASEERAFCLCCSMHMANKLDTIKDHSKNNTHLASLRTHSSTPNVLQVLEQVASRQLKVGVSSAPVPGSYTAGPQCGRLLCLAKPAAHETSHRSQGHGHWLTPDCCFCMWLPACLFCYCSNWLESWWL